MDEFKIPLGVEDSTKEGTFAKFIFWFAISWWGIYCLGFAYVQLFTSNKLTELAIMTPRTFSLVILDYCTWIVSCFSTLAALIVWIARPRWKSGRRALIISAFYTCIFPGGVIILGILRALFWSRP